MVRRACFVLVPLFWHPVFTIHAVEKVLRSRACVLEVRRNIERVVEPRAIDGDVEVVGGRLHGHRGGGGHQGEEERAYVGDEAERLLHGREPAALFRVAHGLAHAAATAARSGGVAVVQAGGHLRLGLVVVVPLHRCAEPVLMVVRLGPMPALLSCAILLGALFLGAGGVPAEFADLVHLAGAHCSVEPRQGRVEHGDNGEQHDEAGGHCPSTGPLQLRRVLAAGARGASRSERGDGHHLNHVAMLRSHAPVHV
mmetsp:Transcript_116762/g.371560  ORF Transcript_116762/g.371560 Transcript_116762/m.371560 type:complete len:254 (-) Transcript_116762:954-1715(-)